MPYPMPRNSSTGSNPELLAPEAVALLQTVVTAFRHACDRIHQQGRLPVNMTNYPRGCCDNCSEILGDYLISRGLAPAVFVKAFKGKRSHAWIEVGNLVIDITGDQFDGRPSVFFDVPDTWVKKWKVDSRRMSVYDFGCRFSGENELRKELHQVIDEQFKLNKLNS